HRFGRYAPAGARGDFALCGARPKGSALWTSASWAQLDQLMSAALPPKSLLHSAYYAKTQFITGGDTNGQNS
ncbi:MAG: hypothetical protein HDT21_12125, partial [Ruminococcus sp.]|nr:hypothetical protein [Ruminococcus sp.]